MVIRAMICAMTLLMLVVANLCFHSSTARAAARLLPEKGTLTSTPVAGPTRATVVVSGSGWQGGTDGTVINFGFSASPFCTAASYTPAMTEQAGVLSGGAFSGWFLWPATTPVGLYAVCVSVGPFFAVAGSYTVLSAAPPQLTISSPTLNVGQQAMVSGRNFLPPQTGITLALQQLSGGTRITLGTATSDANGAFSQTFTIPANPTGPVELLASAGSGTPPTLTASVTFIIYAAVTSTPAPTTTPSPSPSSSPSPTPAPGKEPTPVTSMTVTPTSIPPQQTSVLPVPTPTPMSLGTQPQAPTPISSSTPTGQLAVKTPTSNSEQNVSKKTPALIAAAISILLIAALVFLLWRRKARKGTDRGNDSVYPFYSTVAGIDSFNSIQQPEIVQFAQPTSIWAEGPDWDSLPAIGQQVSISLPELAANTIPDLLPSATSAPQSSDLLQDPLLAAIMQQARHGLFVLPGKKP